MVAAQHAQVWPPMIFIIIVGNFYDSFIAGRRRLEAFVKISFFVLHAGASLLSGPVGLLCHSLTGLALIDILFILVMAFSLGFGIGLVLLSLGYLDGVLALVARLDQGEVLG